MLLQAKQWMLPPAICGVTKLLCRRLFADDFFLSWNDNYPAVLLKRLFQYPQAIILVHLLYEPTKDLLRCYFPGVAFALRLFQPAGIAQWLQILRLIWYSVYSVYLVFSHHHVSEALKAAVFIVFCGCFSP